MKFKLDQNLPQSLAQFLREAGHDAMTVLEEQLVGADDEVVQAAAVREGRILMSFDLDFADIRRYPVGTHPGIVVFRLQDQRWRTLQPHIPRLLGLGPSVLAGGLVKEIISRSSSGVSGAITTCVAAADWGTK